MADFKKLIETLHPLERKVLPVLKTNTTLPEVIELTGLQEVEALRALNWLQNKKILNLTITQTEQITLDQNGKEFLKKSMPERRLLNALKDKDLPMEKASAFANITREELNVSIGLLRSKGMAIILKDKEIKIKITDKGKIALNNQFPEEKFIQKKFPINYSTLNNEEKNLINELKKRKQIITIEQQKQTTAQLLELGIQLQKQGGIEKKIIDQITPQILRSQEWKGKNFRRYDTTLQPPKINLGRLQHYRKFLDDIRTKFISLGFTEMKGPLVETEFWDMDALYMPQFHSARDIHDAYYVKEPKYGILDEKQVKKVHENGGKTGSLGWRYDFDINKTRQLLLRTQGTACSSRMLASPNLQIPGKYFGITRCFRKDVIDATHNCDFHQTEGIIIQEGLTTRHLFGLLRMFAQEFAGTKEIKLVPGYFPFTEPSVELFARHPELGWIELGGAGIFRPEVVQPLLGKNISVLAWGIGIDRIAMFKLGLKDIRALFSQNLEFLRNTKVPY